MERIRLTTRDGRIDVTLTAQPVGEDWLVEITGGQAHIGAGALATFDRIHARASASVVSAPGHREEQVALEAARTISRRTRGTTVVVAGLHYPEITVDEIDIARRLCHDLVKRFLARLAD